MRYWTWRSCWACVFAATNAIPGIYQAQADVGRVKHVVLLMAAPDALHVARVQEPAVVPSALTLRTKQWLPPQASIRTTARGMFESISSSFLCEMPGALEHHLSVLVVADDIAVAFGKINADDNSGVA